jgi:hypothetical protein
VWACEQITNWYKKKIWILWAPKFFRPRLDLVIYVLLTRLIPHHQQQYNKYLCGREKPSWRKDFKKEKKKLITNILLILKSGYVLVWAF